MANKGKKKTNPIVAYFRATRAELKKVRWPTRKQALTMTWIVLIVTFSMAFFLGLLDLGFGWLFGLVISGNILGIMLGVIVTAALLGAAYLIGQGEEV